MSISALIELLPSSVKLDTIDFTPVRLKDGRDATRVVIGHILTEAEIAALQGPHFVGVGCVATYRYAPEIKHSYFYVV